MKRYLDVRFDVTDLDEEERGHLALEVVVQAERSLAHPSVEVEIEWNDVDDEPRCGDPRPDPRTHPEYWTE